MQQEKSFYREHFAGLIIFCCLALIILSMIGIQVLDVKVINVEGVDRGLYTVITQKGPVNVEPNDVLRIERTYTKAAITGTSVELDKIYTTKGFIYASSIDSYHENISQLMNSVDFDGLPTWERENTTWQSVQPYAFAIGTPEQKIPWLFFLLSLQYFMLSIGGITLAILVFPFHWKESKEEKTGKRPSQPHDQDYCAEEQLSAVAK
ncbi:hypothetical protein [Desulfitobacterium sp.]|uniref:hypothetical protein n=1 Tax=Desulfitobacterium sp. TaxID=49981 RepID=UPI002C78EFBB|nr:hypothetical protein [Desulfitobacterium sp.]HVJ48610.1 hypothetical protein [Desulfitobacterium sp.]